MNATITPVDLLAFGPHPDDIEIGMGATVAKHAGLGYRVGLCDLTQGELGSNGTPETRVQEAERARQTLGAAWRVNLALPDGRLEENDDHVRTIVEVVRRACPRAVAINAGADRHPDHVAGHHLLIAAIALVVHLSNFRPVKRVHTVVDVFSRIRRDVRAKLVLAGEGPDVADVQLQADAYGLGGHVEILPPAESVVPLLSVADLFLLPSLQESFGLAALEAMACGVPVVASRVGGLPEVIDHGVTGFLHAPEDLEAMAASGTRLLTEGRLHARIADAARARGVALLRARDRAAIRGDLRRPSGQPRLTPTSAQGKVLTGPPTGSPSAPVPTTRDRWSRVVAQRAADGVAICAGSDDPR